MPKQYLCGQFDVCLYYTRNTQEGNFGKFPRLYPLAKRLNSKAQGFYAHSYKRKMTQNPPAPNNGGVGVGPLWLPHYWGLGGN